MKLYRRPDGTVTTNEGDGELILDINQDFGPHPNKTYVNIVGDQLELDCRSPDTGPAIVSVSGSPSGTVGFDWKVSGQAFQIRYTVQSGDSLQKVADGLRVAMANHVALNRWLASINFHLALDPRTNSFVFNVPWGPSASFQTVGPVSVNYNPRLDNNPFLNMARLVPGRAPMAGDQLGHFRADGQSGANTHIDTQYLKIQAYVMRPDPKNPLGGWSLGCCNGQSGYVAYQTVWGSKGVFMARNDGSGNPLPDPGYGNIAACALVLPDQAPVSPVNGTLWFQGGRLWVRQNGQNKPVT